MLYEVITIAVGQILLILQQGLRHRHRLVVPLLLIALAQVIVETRVLFAHFPDGDLGRLLEPRFTPEHVIEAPGHLAGQFSYNFV